MIGKTGQSMTSLLIVTLLLIGSYDWRVSCDAQFDLQQQQQQQQQLSQVQQSPQPLAQDQQQAAAQGQVAGQIDASAAAKVNVAAGADEQARWEQYKQSPLFLASFDPTILSIPEMQREFVNKMVANDLDLFREILREAIERRNKFAPSVGLMWKYTTKLLGRLISNRREEMKLEQRIEPKPEFFRMIADLADTIIQKSTGIKAERGYSKSNVNTDELYRRVDNIFNYIQKTIEAAPIGAYLKWDELVLFKDDPTNPETNKALVDEASDLTAQFRSMGYESCIFVARRIVNLLRMFSRGAIPQSDKDV